jgi:hypothetical protein
VGIQQVGVGHGEVAFHSPPRTPRVADDEALLGVVVAHCANGVPSKNCFAGAGHGNLASLGNIGTLKALVHGKAEDEGVAARKTALQLVRQLRQAKVVGGFVLGRVFVD